MVLLRGTVAHILVLSAPTGAQWSSPTYLAEQADVGKAVYAAQCASCHGANLDDGPFGPPLKGVEFQQRWGGKAADTLFDYLSAQMPPAAPGSLGEEQYTRILAFLLQQIGVPPGTQPLPTGSEPLKGMVLPTPAQPVGGRITPGIAFPRAPAADNPLDRITPVTDAMLSNPPEGEWLTWRRTVDALGFSPLKQINKNNVGRMQLAWGWSLPPGPNEGTPLMHDGVLFVLSYGDKVQALDAARGNLLWQYSRRLPKGTAPSHKKALAILGHRLYVATSDAHVVALDVKSGNVVWDSPVGSGPDYRMTGGPLVAKGKVIVGTSGRAPGGNWIVALDAGSGQEAWRFATIARPGEPGGDSWNGLPVEKRNGGSVWLPGSYDPVLNLVFFGPAPTYDTAPLRNRLHDGVTTDALFTNATIALNPDNGKLVWHFSHLPNDQWDLDWAFERQVMKLQVRGGLKTVVVTAGKPVIFDVIEAETGKYSFSMDLGLQNFVTAIDPETGDKTIDPRKIPGDGETKFICPNAGGGKGWTPSSYNPHTKLLFVPLVEACMNYTPVPDGERGFLSTGVRLTLAPPLNSDGKYGRLEAINLETRKSVWVNRQRAPLTTGVLATAGGLVFAGSMDRVFAAYDDATGKKLWSTRLNDVPNSNAITYAVNGKQYVAVVDGNGGAYATMYASLVPEILNPPDRSSAIWVFEVSDGHDLPRSSGR
jgi:alcohol dehydrogenase (cytochrome c)